MLQRFVYTAIQSGINSFLTTPALYQDLFANLWQLSAAETSAIQAYFAANPPNVQHAYALEQPRFPLVEIEVKSEMQPLFSLNNYGGPAGTAATGTVGSQVIGATLASNYTHSLDIHCICTKEPELALYLFEMVKYSLTAANLYFQGTAYLMIPAYAGGALELMALESGDQLFRRTLSAQFQRPFVINDANTILGAIKNVLGVEAPTTTAEAGELQLVKTYTPTGQ